MITFTDRTYCSSKTHKPDCDRQVTEQLIKEAEKLGLPIATADFCGETGEQ